MTKKIYAVVFLILSIFISCDNDYNKIEWKITQDENNRIEIELNRKIQNSDLKEIALKIYEDKNKPEKLLIFYNVSSYDEKISYWATTHFNPDLKISVKEDIKWEILKDENNRIEVELEKRINKSELENVSKKVREYKLYPKKLFITYFLANIEGKNAWATAFFNPNLEINIIGSTVSQEKDFDKIVKNNIKGEIIGEWKDVYCRIVLLKNENKKLVLKLIYDDSSSDNFVTKTEKNGVTILKYNNAHGEYYVIESNGNLGMYGKNGKFAEATKIR